jgi:PAS domain S-box-containing protein
LKIADGSIKWANARGSIVVESITDTITSVASKHVKVVGIVQDLTKVWNRFSAECQDPKADTNVQNEVENFMLVTEAIPHLVCANKPSGEICYFNSRWADYTGVNLQTLSTTNWSWENIVHPDDYQETTNSWNRSLTTGQDYECRFRLRRQDGEYRWHLSRGVPIKGSDGTIKRWFSTCTDIHEQKLLEEKARASEMRLKWLIQSFPVNIWTIDTQGVITFMNEQENTDDIGWVPNLIGKTIFEYFDEHGLAEIKPLIYRALSGEKFSAEILVEKYWFDVHYWPLKNDRGEMTGVAGVSADVTIKKQAEKLIISEQSALKVAQMKSEFLTTMSHEIRTPLNGIIGMSEFLAETKLTDEQTKYLDIIQNSSSHLLNLINDILDYSKIDSGKVELEPRNFTLSALLESCMRLFVHKLQSKRLSCGVCVDQMLTKLMMTADEGRISQILINFVSNAIKFTPPNGVINVKVIPIKREKFNQLRNDKVKFLQLIPASKCSKSQFDGEEKSIHITEEKSTEDNDWNISEASTETLHVLFLVRDTGIGVSKETEKKLFSPFVQAMGTHRQFGGTGLGLSICKKLTELMKGEIGVFSVEGQGSLFWCLFPILVKPNTMGELSQSTELVADAVVDAKLLFEPNKRKPSILVVEDHPVNRKLMILTLQKLGCNVTASSNGYEASELLYNQQQKFDVIYMDCHMPGLDGYETSREIRKHEISENNLKPIPIIALTAAALPGDREKCLDAGMNDYITKPVTRQVIAASIKKWIPWA